MVYLISAWHYFRCDTYTVQPYDEVPPNKLNLVITSLAPDLYPVFFLKESRIKFLGGAVGVGGWGDMVWNWLKEQASSREAGGESWVPVFPVVSWPYFP